MIYAHTHVVLDFVGLGEIDKAKAAFESLQKMAPEYPENQVGGHVGIRPPGGSQAGDYIPANRRRPRGPERGRRGTMSRWRPTWDAA